MFIVLSSLAFAGALQGSAEGPIAQPIAPLASLLSDNDYPAEALRVAAQGTVGFRLSIDERGMPTGCVVEQSSGVPSLDAATCSIMLARARFHPARDQRGTAVAGTHVSRIRWVTQVAERNLFGLEPVRVLNRQIVEFGDMVLCEAALGVDSRRALGGCNLEYPTQEVWNFARGHLGHRVYLSDSIAIAPAASSLPAETNLLLGDRYMQLEARITVRADGSVRDCEVISRSGAPPRGLTTPNVCGFYREYGRSIFAAAPASGDERALRISHDYYLRVESAGDAEATDQKSTLS